MAADVKLRGKRYFIRFKFLREERNEFEALICFLVLIYTSILFLHIPKNKIDFHLQPQKRKGDRLPRLRRVQPRPSLCLLLLLLSKPPLFDPPFSPEVADGVTPLLLPAPQC